MTRQYETFKNLKDVKSKISSLDPMNDNALFLEHLVLNSLEILDANNLDTQQVKHTLHKDLTILINCQTNSLRIKYFKEVQMYLKMDFPEGDYSISSIPKEWSWLPADRYGSESENENEH